MKPGSRRHRVPLLAILGLVLLAMPVAAQNFNIQERTLKNGMKVLVQEDPSIPNVALYIFFRVGSRNEHEGITGLSHFFEHMMFNGAKKYGPGEFDKAMEAAGGENNAYTTNDMTVYTDWFPNSQLELIFDLESDRIQNLAFDPKIVESERQVVYSERRLRTDNNNFGLLDEQLEATAIMAHPYHWSVIGWPSDIEKWTLDDLKSYFAKGYSPSNATMVVVGGVKADDVFNLAERYMETIPAHEPPPPVRTVEPRQLGERRVIVHKFAQLPIVEIGYKVPQAQDPDYYTLELLQAVLTLGESSRMYRSLVDGQQLAVEVQSSHLATIDPFLFTFTVQPRQGVAPEKAEQAFYAEIEKIKTSGVDEHELQKAKNQAISDYYRSLRAINRRANVIGDYAVLFGDYHKLGTVEQEYNKVTPADIQRAAQKYFAADNRTVATLIPVADSDSGKANAGDEEDKQ
ncbi:MAG TPA: pitrilysin family protein [Candidatus Sulfotelmatobacter sp.]|nr:pitrilysin family protein [Candidatus Sulfotelmatobacter sp.]